MTDFTEEVPGQIAAGINRLGNGEYTYYSIYPLPPEAEYDEVVHSEEWIQTTGVAPDRLTVEIKQRDAHGVHRLYTIGRPAAATEPAETEPIQNGDNTYRVRPAEVLTTTDAIELFQHYYDTHTVPADWNLREQPEFADTAVAETQETASATGGTSSTGRAPVDEKADSSTASKPKGRPKSAADRDT